MRYNNKMYNLLYEGLLVKKQCLSLVDYSRQGVLLHLHVASDWLITVRSPIE